jgi:hypothetical protein
LEIGTKKNEAAAVLKCACLLSSTEREKMFRTELARLDFITAKMGACGTTVVHDE